MEYTVKLLTLYRDLFYCIPDTEGAEADSALFNRDETLSVYRNGVGAKQLVAEKRAHLLDGRFCGYALREGVLAEDITTLAAGKYLFAQGLYSDMDEMLAAAEQVWLESLWRDIIPSNDTVYIRTVVEDNRKVFQVFRQVP
ncbi:MAG: hypothetical protein LBU99_03550 [Spirochaetaceae bacterium]|nr:hypothetical protein [Spirochaetaceae bacterium]